MKKAVSQASGETLLDMPGLPACPLRRGQRLLRSARGTAVLP